MSDEKRFHARLFWLQSGAREVFETHRVRVCCRVTVPLRKVEIWGNVEDKRAKYRNVIRCGSVWHCPVCANNITAHRRSEIEQVISVFREVTLPVMVSFTLRHKREDSLMFTLDTLTKSWRTMTSGKAWTKLSSDCLRGYVKSLEVTFGISNGWHPHYPVLFFVNPEVCLTKMYAQIKDRWMQSVVVSGGSSNEHATRMTTTDASVAGYIAKWGHEPRQDRPPRLSHWGHAAEMVRGGIKRGKRGHLTPFDMLELYVMGGDHQPMWAALCAEYGKTMVGQRQIAWSRSPNMRQEAGIKKELEDSDVVEGTDAGYYLLATIEPDDWSAILWAGCQGGILDVG